MLEMSSVISSSVIVMPDFLKVSSFGSVDESIASWDAGESVSIILRHCSSHGDI